MDNILKVFWAVTLLGINNFTGSSGQLCLFDEGLCGWMASGDLAWDIHHIDSGDTSVGQNPKAYIAEVRVPPSDTIVAYPSVTRLTSPTHHGSPTIKNSMLSFAYLLIGPSSLTVEAEIDRGSEVIELWSSKRILRDLDNRWMTAEVPVPESKSFSISLLAEVQPGSDASLGISNVTLVVGDTNECVDNPCVNSGICVDGDGYYTCLCGGGYRGTQCQIAPKQPPNALQSIGTNSMTTIDQTETTTQDVTTTEQPLTTWYGTTLITEILSHVFTSPIQQTSAATTFGGTFKPTTVEITAEYEEQTTIEETTFEPITALEATTDDVTTAPMLTTRDEMTEDTITTDEVFTTEGVEPVTTLHPTTIKVPITERTTVLRTTANTYPTEKPQQTLTPGEIAGIVVGAVLFFIFCFLLILYFILYERKHKAYNLNYIDQEFVMEYVNRPAPQTQKYTGHWTTDANNVRGLNNETTAGETSQPTGSDVPAGANHVNSAFSMDDEVNTTQDETRSSEEGENDTTREDETNFIQYPIDPDMPKGGTERFI